MQLSAIANFKNLTKDEYQYYKYVFEMEKLQKQIQEIEQMLSIYNLKIDDSVSRKIKNEENKILNEKDTKSIGIYRDYTNDLKKHKIKYCLIPTQRIKRKRKYENDLKKNSVIYDSQISVLQESNKEALESERKKNKKINDRVRMLTKRKNSIYNQIELLREKYYGDIFLEEKNNQKIKRKD